MSMGTAALEGGKLGIPTILLDASYEWIFNRLSKAENSKAKLRKRPLFSEPEKAKTLYDERKKDYKEVADVVINVEDKSIKNIIKEIHKRVAS